MEYRNLKGTDLNVSRACFGTMTFGGQVDEWLAVRMVDRCLAAGINFFDTANVYTQGASEELLGRALRGRRQEVVLASKVGMKVGDAAGEKRLSREAITRDLEDSLRRLQTDYLDLYYLHQPDYGVPLEETLEVLDGLVRQEKILYPAASNFASWQTVRMLDIADGSGYRRASVAQQMYNVLARGLEQEFVPMSKEMDISVIAYNPLAGGLLTGKHQQDEVTPGTRFDSNSMYQDRYWRGQNFRAVERLRGAGEEAGRSLISLSLNWLLHHTVADCVILGASKMEQLEQNLSSLAEGPLSAETLGVVEEVWGELRGAAPVYNR
jgi:aryl-alcohol dehydrogenase-like predicted oxidoreductase